MTSRNVSKLEVIGWREWVSLPALGIEFIKAKVDTGARSSSLHAFEIKKFKRDGESWVRFRIHPVQRNTDYEIEVEAKLLEYRTVRSSSGNAESRPVILTEVEMLGTSRVIELTLANRDQMGFRMLLGREAIRTKYAVDAGQSFYGGKPPKTERFKLRRAKSDAHPAPSNSEDPKGNTSQ